MSIIQSSKLGCSVISHETVNFSTSHQKFTFGKGRRFKSISITTPTDFTVDLPSTFGKRSPSFGFGERFKLLVPRDKLNMPPPTAYTLKTCFDGENPTIKRNHLTTDFRQQSGREHYEKVFMPGSRSPRQMEFVPGPGAYSFVNQAIGQDGRKFTLKARFKNNNEPEEMARKQATPGPGSYKPMGIDSVGKYCLSTIPNSLAQAWNPPTSSRFKDQKKSMTSPEPTTYNPSDTGCIGQYIVSTFKNNRVKKFMLPNTNTRNINFTRIQTPGPGSYVLPSDFGILQSNKETNRKPGTSAMTTRRARFGESQMTGQMQVKDGLTEFDSQYMARRSSQQGNRPKFMNTQTLQKMNQEELANQNKNTAKEKTE